MGVVFGCVTYTATANMANFLDAGQERCIDKSIWSTTVSLQQNGLYAVFVVLARSGAACPSTIVTSAVILILLSLV